MACAVPVDRQNAAHEGNSRRQQRSSREVVSHPGGRARSQPPALLVVTACSAGSGYVVELVARARTSRCRSAWSPSRPASTSPRPTAPRSRRRCSATSTTDSSSRTRPARSCRTWRSRGPSRRTARPTRSPWSTTRSSPTAPRSPSADAVFSINRVKTNWTTSLKAAMDVVQTAKADLADRAAGDPEQAEQRLALPDDHPDRRDVLPDRGRQARHGTRSAPARTSSARGSAATRSCCSATTTTGAPSRSSTRSR